MDALLASLRAAAEPTRLRILLLCGQTDLTVSELMRILSQSQPRVSRHLKLLVEAGLLERFQEGSWVFHRAAREGLGAQVLIQLADLVPEGDATVLRDKDHLAQIKRERAEAAAGYFRANAAQWDQVRSLHIDDTEVERLLLSLLPMDGIDDLLDVGTGTGRILELMAPRIGQGIGIDSSRDMLAMARTNLDKPATQNCQVRQNDMYQMALPNKSFDAAVIHQVLHYAEDPARAIAETARVLRPGGILLVADFAPHGQEELRTRHNHRRLGFTDAEIGGWFANSGLETRRISHLRGDPLTVTVWLAIKPEYYDETETSNWVWLSDVQNAVH